MLATGLNGAVGLRHAERIFSRALTVHLVRNSRFIDARLACIQSAEDLFGSGSRQVQKSTEAFGAVEIFDAAPPTHRIFPAFRSQIPASLCTGIDSALAGWDDGKKRSATGRTVSNLPTLPWPIHAPPSPAMAS